MQPAARRAHPDQPPGAAPLRDRPTPADQSGENGPPCWRRSSGGTRRPAGASGSARGPGRLLRNIFQDCWKAGLPFQLLNARQDADEAQIIARAGEPGRITVATNMQVGAAPTSNCRRARRARRPARHLHRASARFGRIDIAILPLSAFAGDSGRKEAFVSGPKDELRDHAPQAAAGALPGVARSRHDRAGAMARRARPPDPASCSGRHEIGDQLAFSVVARNRARPISEL